MQSHFDFPVPYTRELTLPYRTNKRLEDKIRWVFGHPTFRQCKREKFLELDRKLPTSLLKDMSTRGFAMAKHFLDHPHQYGHKMDNIHLQILVRMWQQVYKYRMFLNEDINEYWTAEVKLIKINNGLLEELIRSVKEDDCTWSGDDMVKVRNGIGLRDKRMPTYEGGDTFEYLCGLGENECIGDEVANGMAGNISFNG